MAARTRSSRSPRLRREDWLEIAREALVEGGISSVRVERLAKSLGVTRGSFYWHFDGRGELVKALLEWWEQEATAPFEEILLERPENPMDSFLALCELWLEEERYKPVHDAAVRDWGRTSAEAARAVRRVDKRRIELIQRIFEDFGYAGDEAFIRARVVYFHQVGYYTLGLLEDEEERRGLLPLYTKVLTGRDL